MQILFIGDKNYLMVDIHNYLSKYFKVQSVGFNRNLIERYMNTLSVDLVLLNLKNAEKQDLKSIQFLRQDPEWFGTKLVVLGFPFEFNLFREYLRGADLCFTYPVKNEKLLADICLLCRIDNPQITGIEETGNLGKEGYMKHILVVDDDARMLRAVKSWLQGIYKVSVVNSGSAAMVYLNKQIPDLILLDYEMPDYNGPQTLEILRQQEQFKDIPVVFLTGVSDSEKVKNVFHLNPQGYILKGVTREEMIMKLNEIFSKM